MPPASTPSLRLVALGADAARARSVASTVTASEPIVVARVAELLATLRREPIDAALVLHAPPAIDGLVVARALRGAGDETPVALLGAARAIDFEATAWDAGADEYACLTETTSAQLAGRLRRAVEARDRLREARRALVAQRRLLERDQREADRMVAAQRRLVAALRSLPGPAHDRAIEVRRPPGVALGAYTRGVGASLISADGPSAELAQLADDLAAEGVTGSELLDAHLAAVARATADLPERGALDLRASADQLLVAAVVHLAEAYRRRTLRGVPVRETPASRAA